MTLLGAARTKLARDGVIVVVEYGGARANPWVPHPISPARLRDLADAAKLESPVVVSDMPSRYHRSLYCAVLRS